MVVQKQVERLLKQQSMVNIIIAGMTCSGKTTFSHSLQKSFSDKYSVTIVCEDDYFKDIKDIPRGPFGAYTDSIDAFHTTEFVRDVETLLFDGVVMMPRYNVATNTRVSKNKIVRVGEINIFEGLHTINLLSNLQACITIFIDTKPNICLARRIERDSSKYGIPKKRIEEYFSSCILPMSEKYILPQKTAADIVIKCEDGEKG
jgi:uridine kinase